MNHPLFIIISGPPGAGKSTLARSLAREFKLFLLDKDLIDEPFSPNERGDHYSEVVEPKVLSAMLALAKENLGLGNSVILDLPLTHILLNTPHWQEKFYFTQPLHQKITFELVIQEDLLKKRILGRGLQRDQFRLSDQGWEKFRKTDRLGEAHPLPHITLDAHQTQGQVFEKAKNYINSLRTYP